MSKAGWRLNSLRSGEFARVPLADLPVPFKFVKRVVLAFRRGVEEAVIERHGTVSIYAAKRLHTACLAVRQLACVERILRDCGAPGEKLTHAEWIGYSDRLLKYSEAADKALQDLGLDKRESADAFDSIYRVQQTPENEAETAADAEPGDDEPDAAAGETDGRAGRLMADDSQRDLADK